jgi:hypothetical protein
VALPGRAPSCRSTWGGNSDGRGTDERLQVDPNKGSVLFLGTNQDGLYKSTDSGVTWSQVAGFPTTVGTTFVAFDKSTGTPGSATSTIYVGVASTTGNALYRSTDGGTTWAAVSGGPAGLMPLQAALDGNGHLVLTYGNALGPNGVSAGAVFKLTLANNGWTDITPAAPTNTWQFGYGGLAVNARDPNTIVVSTIDRWSTGDDLYKSTDGGATWTGLNAISTHAGWRGASGRPFFYQHVVPGLGAPLGGNDGHLMTGAIE